MTIFNKKTKELVELIATYHGADILKDFFELGNNRDFKYNEDMNYFEMTPLAFDSAIDYFDEMITTDRDEANENDEMWYADTAYIEHLN